MNSEVDKDLLGKFLQYTSHNLMPIHKMGFEYRYKNKFWCRDWEEIEIAKYLFIGRGRYHSDPIPKRLETNEKFNMNEIERKAESFIKLLRAMMVMEGVGDLPDSLYLIGCGRGIKCQH